MAGVDELLKIFVAKHSYSSNQNNAAIFVIQSHLDA
jgi:hypothetical protein